jgi:hypothetical protein
LANNNGAILFAGDDGTHGYEIWRLIPDVLAGTADNDNYTLRLDPSGSFIDVYVNCPTSGLPTYQIAREGFASLTIDAGQGDDTLTIDGSNGTFATDGIVFKGGSGNDTLNIIGCTYSLATDALTSTEQLTINLDQGSSAASIIFNASQHLAGLNIGRGCSAQLAFGDVLVTEALAIGPSAILKLEDHDLVVRTTAQTRSAVLEQVSRWIAAGQPAQSQNRPIGGGAIFSQRVADDMTGLAIAINEKGANHAPLFTTFDGRAVGINDILVKYTWNGDVNLDGAVDAADYFLVDSGFLTQEGQYRNGDLNLDGKVDAADYFLVDSAFIAQTGALAAKRVSPLQELFSTKPLL